MFYAFLISSMRATCPAHRILLDFITKLHTVRHNKEIRQNSKASDTLYFYESIFPRSLPGTLPEATHQFDCQMFPLRSFNSESDRMKRSDNFIFVNAADVSKGHRRQSTATSHPEHSSAISDYVIVTIREEKSA
jgi:hypothetical protein